MDRWFERLTEQVTIARAGDIRGVLQGLTEEAGFSSYAYLCFQPGTQTAVSSYGFEWQDRYFNEGYVEIDPVIQTARDRMEPFAWSMRSAGRPIKALQQFYSEAAEFGIRSGITIPIPAGYTRTAMLTLASDQLDFAERQVLNPIPAVASFGQVHARLEMMHLKPTRRTNTPLKAVELTCLRWSAEGKCMKDIADIENTTYSNVCFHLRNAKRALGVYSLPQATALAKEFGLI